MAQTAANWRNPKPKTNAGGAKRHKPAQTFSEPPGICPPFVSQRAVTFCSTCLTRFLYGVMRPRFLVNVCSPKTRMKPRAACDRAHHQQLATASQKGIARRIFPHRGTPNFLLGNIPADSIFLMPRILRRKINLTIIP